MARGRGAFLCWAAFSAASYGAIRVDITPTLIAHKNIIIDQLKLHNSQLVQVFVKNVGNSPLRTLKPIKVAINDTVYSGFLYGTEEKGSLRGGPVEAGETGKITLQIPANSFRHCQLLKVQIDVDQEVQTTTNGNNVFANDQRSLISREFDNKGFCRLAAQPFLLVAWPHHPEESRG